MTKKDCIIKAGALRKKPSESHSFLKARLEEEGVLNDSWREYQVIRINGRDQIVNFLKEDTQEVVIIGNDAVISHDYRIYVYPPFVKKEEYDTWSQQERRQIRKDHFYTSDVLSKAHSDISLDMHLRASQEELSDLIGNAPNWLLRSGITMIFIVTFLLLALSYLVSYPDKLEASGYITTVQPPLELHLQRTGRIAEIFTEHGEYVQKRQKLIYLDNAAHKDDVDVAYNLIMKEVFPKSNISGDRLRLGPMQNIWAQYVLTIGEYRQILEQNTSKAQVATLESERQNIDLLNGIIKREEAYFNVEEDIALKELKRAEHMFQEALISEREYQQVEANYNKFLREIEQTDKSQIQNRIRQDQLELEQIRIREQRTKELQQYRLRLNEFKIQFLSLHDQWLKDNFLEAEQTGVVDWMSRLTEGQMIQAGQHLGYILPQTDQQKTLIAKVSANGYAQLDSSSKVLIKLHAYPYKEYGAIQTSIDQLALIPYNDQNENTFYELRIPLGETLLTTYNKKINYKPNISANVELITDHKSVLTRIFDQLVDLIYNKP